MKVIRVHITGWVSSFRNPLFISGFQPTLALPPLSAIYGLLTAAKGEWVTPHDAAVGYVFQSHGKAVDLETVYEFAGKLDAKSNINKREFLVKPELYLYTPEMWLRKAFERPEYPLLMGRSSEIATVTAIEEIELERVSETTYQNTLIPFPPPADSRTGSGTVDAFHRRDAAQTARNARLLSRHRKNSLPRRCVARS